MRKSLMFLAVAMMFSVAMSAQNAETVNVAGAPNGKFSAVGNDCTIQGQVLNGQKEGTWIEYFTGDSFLPKRVITYQNGKKNGVYIEIDKTGSITKQAEYKDDQLNGQVSSWFRGGRLSKMNTYNMGVMEGRQIMCYEKGGVQEESFYLKGQRNGVCTWYDENGNKMMTIEYKSGLFEGKQETFYSNGQLKSSKNYKDNKQDGEAKEYYDNGSLKSESTFKQGQQSGKTKTYEKTNTPAKANPTDKKK